MFNKKAFTLVELIVVITIISILGTLGFISMKDVVKRARNSVRISDLGSIEKALQIHYSEVNQFPIPDQVSHISYSGGILWSQGVFGKTAQSKILTISEPPVDPTYKTQYPYTVLSNKKRFQVSTLIDGALFSNTPISTVHAGVFDKTSITKGNYGYKDILAKNGNNCSLITAPSIYISNVTSNTAIIPLQSYNFIYKESQNVAKIYEPFIGNVSNGGTFQIKEVLRGCNISTIGGLNKYINDLSESYQQILSSSKFNELIFHSQTKKYMKDTIIELKDKGITVNPGLIGSIDNDNFFIDNFNTNNKSLVSSHSSSYGGWKNIGNNFDVGSYSIDSNLLIKDDNIDTLIAPVPYIPLNSPNTTTNFDVIDFSLGSINIFNRYIDDDNYYKIELKSTGYEISSRIAGTSIVLQSILDPIMSGDTIELSVIGGNIRLLINGVQKENIVDFSILLQGEAAISLENSNAKINNYSLIYN